MAFALVAALGAGTPALAQGGDRAAAKDLTAGSLLVAGRGLGDPNFARTLVVLAQYGKDGAMGLILNRPTEVVVASALSGGEAAANAKDPVYEGGPVGTGGLLALARSATPIDGATRVTGDVYLLSSRSALDRKIAAGARGDSLRIYAGYSGWGPGQLERELESGAWHVFRADASTIFDADPEHQWQRFIRRTELRFALLPLLRDRVPVQ